MFQKQTISLENQKIDEKTIKVLKRGDRYKLFKFTFQIDGSRQDYNELIYRMLDEMPELEVSKISGFFKNDDVISILAEKPMFKTKKDLFKVIQLNSIFEPNNFQPFEYLSYISNPEWYDMS